ncbi:hypothetical protein GCK72_020214 [Caenorhabditis remanei]|uniref:Uncharacterized protein n=1 Tax=Caenorhabditis remanei TaxID=31234 RepID=A0A6A5GEI7_CAERE|nr:hypothetical protein GCK72_020214 [Caenorhabditis remanei]KAF1753657.1 hypothetical protein GCK72_020214 [Caenorhabditis remanei]
MLLLPTMAGYTLGLLTNMGVPTILQTISVLLFLEYVLLSILAIFENRFHIVCNFNWKPYWTSIRRVWLGAHYLIGLVILIPFAFLTPDQDIAKKLIFQQLPCLPDYIYNAPIFVTSDSYTYHITVLVTFLIFGVSEAILIILLLITNTIQQLRAKKMSQKLFEIQKKFFIALVIQMMVPLIFLLIPLSYACCVIYYNYYNQAITNIGVAMESIHGIVSTIVMIFIHRPYREAFFSMFSKRPRSTSSKSSQRFNVSNNRVVPLRVSMNKV